MQANTLFLRDAVATDAPALAELKLATFRETFIEGFAIPYPPADLARFEAETYGSERVAAELADPAHRTWVVEAPYEGEANAVRPNAGRLVAYAHVGPCKIPHPDVVAGEAELYQLYLRREAQGAGLGRRLLDHALAFLAADVEARKGGAGTGGRVWLGVWSGNLRAQALYARYGFVVVGEYKFRVGDWLDDELILRCDPPSLP